MTENKDIFIKMNVSASIEEIQDFFTHSLDLTPEDITLDGKQTIIWVRTKGDAHEILLQNGRFLNFN